MNHYPDNTVSQWKTKLNDFIELQDKCEVGLLEVLFPYKVHNIFGSYYRFAVRAGLFKNEYVLWT